MYPWIVFVHVLSVLIFFMAHGASMVMAWQVRRERDLPRIQAMLDLSNAAIPIAYGALLLLIVAGVAAGVMGGWFAMGWIWAAIVLLVVLFFVMYAYSARYFRPMRLAVGLPYHAPSTPDLRPKSQAEIEAAVTAGNPAMLFVGSLAIVAVILWLMMMKPF
ncbi:MAG TPA: hypothetical protein VHD90_10145 [Phototrophicaceae bacterium]|nr:hypothetical protein [Phototrophicaceae bacterium]